MEDSPFSERLERTEFLFSQIMRRIHAYPSRKVLKADVTFAQMKVLWILNSMGECSMSELARSLSVTRSTATTIVNRLVRDGFVKRLRSEADRRWVRLRILSKGKRLISLRKKHRRERLTMILENISPDERRVFIDALEKIYEILDRFSVKGEKERGKAR